MFVIFRRLKSLFISVIWRNDPCGVRIKYSITKLYELYSLDVFRYALSILKDEEDAKDALQEAFTRYFEKEKTFRDESSQKTFLLVIARNYCYSKLNRCEESNLSLDENIGLAAPVPEYENELSMKEALSRLSAGQSELFYLKVHCRYTNIEIAEMTGQSVDNVTVKLFRIRQFLRKCLEEKNETHRILSK